MNTLTVKMRPTPGCGRDDGFLDERGERLTLAQHRLDLSPGAGLDADGRQGGGAHGASVWLT